LKVPLSPNPISIASTLMHDGAQPRILEVRRGKGDETSPDYGPVQEGNPPVHAPQDSSEMDKGTHLFGKQFHPKASADFLVLLLLYIKKWAEFYPLYP